MFITSKATPYAWKKPTKSHTDKAQILSKHERLYKQHNLQPYKMNFIESQWYKVVLIQLGKQIIIRSLLLIPLIPTSQLSLNCNLITDNFFSVENKPNSYTILLTWSFYKVERHYIGLFWHETLISLTKNVPSACIISHMLIWTHSILKDLSSENVTNNSCLYYWNHRFLTCINQQWSRL